MLDESTVVGEQHQVLSCILPQRCEVGSCTQHQRHPGDLAPGLVGPGQRREIRAGRRICGPAAEEQHHGLTVVHVVRRIAVCRRHRPGEIRYPFPRRETRHARKLLMSLDYSRYFSILLNISTWAAVAPWVKMRRRPVPKAPMAASPEKQSASAVLMIRPANFGANPETAGPTLSRRAPIPAPECRTVRWRSSMRWPRRYATPAWWWNCSRSGRARHSGRGVPQQLGELPRRRQRLALSHAGLEPPLGAPPGHPGYPQDRAWLYAQGRARLVLFGAGRPLSRRHRQPGSGPGEPGGLRGLSPAPTRACCRIGRIVPATK